MNALIFDLDDTLVVEEASAEKAFIKTCEYASKKFNVNPKALYTNIREACCMFWHQSPARAYCVNVSISSWEGLWAQFTGDDKNLQVLSQWAEIYRKNSWQEALKRCDCTVDDSAAIELGEMYRTERRKLHVVYDDVIPMLKYFKSKYKLGLLTNGAPDLQRTKINGSGLEAYFDEIIVSGEIGFGKPDIRIFKHILHTLDTTPEFSVMIGDSLKSDIKPALELGMKAVWIKRGKNDSENNSIPYTKITNLYELKKILD